MPRFPKPFFRKSRNLWYVEIDGRQHNLGSDREKAFEAYHRFMQQPRENRRVPTESVAAMINEFLEWTQQHRAPETYVWYQSRLQSFVKRCPDLCVEELRPFHVQRWIDSYRLSSGSKRNFARSIMRCMTWCEEQGLIDRGLPPWK